MIFSEILGISKTRHLCCLISLLYASFINGLHITLKICIVSEWDLKTEDTEQEGLFCLINQGLMGEEILPKPK